MTTPESLSKAQLLELLEEKEQELQSKEVELQSHRQQLRELDIALQTQDLTIEELTQERDEYKLAYDYVHNWDAIPAMKFIQTRLWDVWLDDNAPQR